MTELQSQALWRLAIEWKHEDVWVLSPAEMHAGDIRISSPTEKRRNGVAVIVWNDGSGLAAFQAVTRIAPWLPVIFIETDSDILTLRHALAAFATATDQAETQTN